MASKFWMSALVSELIEVDVFSLVREPVDAVTTIAASVSSVGAVAAGAAAGVWSAANAGDARTATAMAAAETQVCRAGRFIRNSPMECPRFH